MNPSYCRIRVAKEVAFRRFANWCGLGQVGPLISATCSNAVSLACDENRRWRGRALFVSQINEWTLFQDLSGALGFTPGSAWREFAENDELVFAGYNDAVPYA